MTGHPFILESDLRRDPAPYEAFHIFSKYGMLVRVRIFAQAYYDDFLDRAGQMLHRTGVGKVRLAV